MNLKRFARLGPLLAAALAVGCAQERPPINRVQADALSKHFFAGPDLADPSQAPQFYWRNFVVDTPVSQSLAGIGSWSGVDRIRWEILEHQLLARKAYQVSAGADNKGASQADPNGVIVASYNITGHFDIRRAYNPTTGEELNVVEENSSDRPWYQREYFRVDWSSNTVNNPMWEDMFVGKAFGEISVNPLAYYENDPTSPNAPHFDVDQGYFDVTNHYMINPAMSPSPFSDLTGSVPTCLLVGIYTGSATYNCDAQEAVVRSSYLRIDPSEDFQSLENTVAPQDVIANPGGLGNGFDQGVLTPGQQGWDPGYGYTDALYHRFANIHNIWQASHTQVACTSNVDSKSTGTADQCASVSTGHTGSQCDTFSSLCTIPYRDRQIKTVGYWVNQEMPADLLDTLDANGQLIPGGPRGASEDLVYSWNQLMSNAVGRAREIECRRTATGGTPQSNRLSCHSQFFSDDGSKNNDSGKSMLSFGGWLVDTVKETVPVLTLCHNPVRYYDLTDTCGAVGYPAVVGDIRRNFLFYWPYDSRAPWGGLANWNADPLTGRIIGAAATIMGRSATFAAAAQRDVIQLAIGDISVTDISNGQPSVNYAKYEKSGYSPEGLTAEQIGDRVKAIDSKHAAERAPFAPMGKLSLAEAARAHFEMQKSMTADPTEQSTAQLDFDATVKPLVGSKYEADLVDSHWLTGTLGLQPGTQADAAMLAQASPLQGLDSGRIDAWRQVVDGTLRTMGACFTDDPEAPIAGSIDMQGLGGYFAKKYATMSPIARGQAIYHDLWVQAFKGISIHEIGHSLGMLHNFASSWDSMNYQPQYWQLRTNETATLPGGKLPVGTSSADCGGNPRPAGNNDTCLGPRYLDPQTDDEQGMAKDTQGNFIESRPGIEYFANTSVMEYQIERFSETVGLGTWDQHMMNALYGRVLETMDEHALGTDVGPVNAHAFAPRLESMLGEADRITREFTPQPGQVFAWQAHYTTTARLMGVFDPARDCRPATAAEKAQGEWRIVHGKVCAPAPRDHAAWVDFVSDNLPAAGGGTPAPFWHTNPTAKTGPDSVRWYYRYGEARDAYFHVEDSDNGADPYEVTRAMMAKFDVSYPTQYFRRQNREYQFLKVPAATMSRWYNKIRAYHWLVANSNAFYTQLGFFNLVAPLDDWQRPYLVAETDMFNFFARAMLMPEPGDYWGAPTIATPPDVTKNYYDTPQNPGQGNPAFTVGIVDGRFIGEDYGNLPTQGGSWNYLNWMNHAGFGTEKTFAARALTDGRPNLVTISRQNYLDGRAVDINFRNDMPQALDRLIGGVLAEDWDSVSPYVTNAMGKNPSPQLLDLTVANPVRPANANILFPNFGYKQQLGALVFVESFSRLNTDMTLINKMRLWIDGQVGSVNVPDAQQVRFYDPNSGYTYIARKYGADVVDGKTIDAGIASRMLQHANALLAGGGPAIPGAYLVQTDNNGNVVVDKYGTPQLLLDANGNPQQSDPNAIGALVNYVGLLDATRQVGAILGYGPLDGTSSGD